MEKDVNKAKKHLKKKANKAAPEINTLIEEVKVSVTKLAVFLGGGFAYYVIIIRINKYYRD